MSNAYKDTAIITPIKTGIIKLDNTGFTDCFRIILYIIHIANIVCRFIVMTNAQAIAFIELNRYAARINPKTVKQEWNAPA